MDASFRFNRHNNVIGGAALWAVSGLKPNQYQGIAKFYQYITRAPIQEQWYQNTGYIPFVLQGVENASASKQNSMITLDVARFDLSHKTRKQSLLYKIPLNQIRNINDEALEAIFSNMKSPAEAMHHAEARANFALKRFSGNNRIIVN
jgi:sn-glycerol 3-phosphate transport system substrate-binding protein